MREQEPIAIVGSACRFPGGADSPSKLWDLLANPRDLLEKVPSSRYNAEAYYHPEPTHHGTSNVRESYFIKDDPAKFDNNFFNIQPAESEAIDPQQRVLLETAYDSLCDAGFSIDALKGSSTSVFVGVMCDDWSGLLTRDWETTPTYASTGMGRSILSNRISYFFDWHGPSMTIDTACSSSLVAVHQAVQTLLSGESRVALAAGSNLILSPVMYIAESNLRMLSPSGRCRMWDADADGYGRGEGVAAVMLKTLTAALEDGDQIEGIIRATAINQDGRTTGLTMPSGNAQANLIRETYARAGLEINNPHDRPQFFQAHGTGTPAGDPQEAEAIHSAFFASGYTPSPDEKLLVGSVKTVIGHTEGTAGLASLIASTQALRHGIVPPNMHFKTLSPLVAPFTKHLEVPTSAKAWPKLEPGQAKRVSINSFGFGGTNAHVIVESFEHSRPIPKANDILSDAAPFVFSAASEASLRDMLRSHMEFLKANMEVNLRDLAWTLYSRRSTLPYRKAVAASSAVDLLEKLSTCLEAPDEALKTRHFNKPKARILGIFTGQGAQWARMGALLIERSPLVRGYIEQLDQSLADLPCSDRPSWTIRDELLRPEGQSQVAKAEISQPLCTAIQIVLVNLLRLSNIELDAVVGHSSGEIGAAYASGLISADDAIRIAYYRGLVANMARSPDGGPGAMMAVGTTVEDASDLCALDIFCDDQLQVAAVNSSSSVTLSGDESAIDEALDILKDEGKFARKLRVDTAYHSRHMQPCAGPYLKKLDEHVAICSRSQAGRRPKWYSSVTTCQSMSRETLNSQYWVDNMTRPVLFSDALANALGENDGVSFDLVLEIGPHPVLKGPSMSCFEEATHGSFVPPPYVGLLDRAHDDSLTFSSALGYIWTHLGAKFLNLENLSRHFTGENLKRQMVTKLPPYPFAHDRPFYNLSRVSGVQLYSPSMPHPLLGRRCTESSTVHELRWRNVLQPKEISWLAGHRLQGQILFAATAYVSMAIDAMASLRERPADQFKLDDIEIGRAMGFNDENASVDCLFTLRITDSDEHRVEAEFSCYSSTSHGTPMVRHANGRITSRYDLGDDDDDSSERPSIIPAENYNLISIEVDRFYRSLLELGYQYDSPFNGIREIQRKLGYAQGVIEDLSDSAWEDQMIVHPGMMDTALQTSSAAYSCPEDGRLSNIHVPTSIRSVTINPKHGSLGTAKHRQIPYRSAVRESYRGESVADIELLNQQGSRFFMQVEGLRLKPFMPLSAADDVVKFAEFRYDVSNVDAKLAVGDDRPSTLDIERASDLERISYFYLRSLQQTVTAVTRAKALPHYQRLLEWADHVVETVARGEHHAVLPEHNLDSKERIQELIAKYPDRADVQLVEVVGENLPTVIEQNGNILEHMTKNGILDAFYAVEKANDWIARLAAQLAHRYPRMKILEIGAGTGGTTRTVLPTLGSAFSSYTYTDISSGFFEAAEERFASFANRMVFKTFDMEKSPLAQGYIEGSYDLIIAANVLHATDKLHDMMTHVRRLLRPGGYLMVFEIVTNKSLQIGLPMGGLPGWWVGADSGRRWGPTLTLQQWDTLLKECGFNGLDTVSPPYHMLHPGAVFAAQAVDDRTELMRRPLRQPFETPLDINNSGVLVVVGGKTTLVQETLEGTLALIRKGWKIVHHIKSLEQLANLGLLEGFSVISLTDLDQPVLRDYTSTKHESLKLLWGCAHNILWVTKNARNQEPYSLMMVGLGRTMRTEFPNLNLQMLDIEVVDEQTPGLLAEAILRLELWEIWSRKKLTGNTMWTVEPEIVLQNGHAQIPRLYPRVEANMRFNSSRRSVTRAIDPKQTPLHLHHTETGAITLQDTSPLRVLSTPLSAASQTTIEVSHSLLRALKVEGVGYVSLCAGINKQTDTRVFALALNMETPAPTLTSWTITQTSELDVAKGLLSIGASIMAAQIFSIAVPVGTLWVHDADRALARSLLHHAEKRKYRLFLTTSRKDRSSDALRYLHPNWPQRAIERLIPEDITAFVDLSGGPETTDQPKSKNFSDCLAQTCISVRSAALLGRNVELALGASDVAGQKALQAALEAATDLAAYMDINEQNMIPLSATNTHSMHSEALLTCVSWNESSLVNVEVQAIDQGVIFEPGKTFVLLGLTGELGQSLVHWMVARGAKHLALTSRRPAVDASFVESMAKYGAEVKILSSDITDRDSLQECFADIRQTMPPIAGVANGAMILRDAMFANMTFEDWMACVRPKVNGTALLDELLYDDPLDFFIVFSSITTVVGNSGQSNYAAANMFMAGIAAGRRARGLAGSTIDISSLIGLGYVERSDRLSAGSFTRLGYTNIAEPDLHQLFAEAIAAGCPQSNAVAEIVTGVSPKYVDEEAKGHFYADPKFAHFLLDRVGAASQTHVKAVAVPLRTLLAAVETIEQAEDVISDAFLSRMKKTLQIPQEEIVDKNIPLVELGLDSLMAVEVRKWFLRELGIDMPVLKILAGGTASDLVQDSLQRQTVFMLGQGPENPSSDPSMATEVNLDDSRDRASSQHLESLPVAIGEPTDNEKTAMEITAKLSFGQARFWFLQNYMEDPTTFNMAVMFRLTGPLDINALELAVKSVAQRHEIMRTRVVPLKPDGSCIDDDDDDDDDIPLQGISPTSHIRLEKHKIHNESQAYEQLRLMHRLRWDLHSWESVKMRLLSLSDNVHYLIVGAHHITLDGLSFSTLFVDLEAFYSGKSLDPLQVTSQYRSFAAQQHTEYESGSMQQSIEHFRQTLGSLEPEPIPLLSFAKTPQRQSIDEYKMHAATVKLDSTTSGLIRKLARRYESTSFHFYLAALQTQLFQLLPSMQNLCIGIADANRLDHKFIGTMGFMLNLLPLCFQRNTHNSSVTALRDTVRATRDQVFAALQHSNVPFDLLLSELRWPRSADHNPLFQVLVDYRQIVQERKRFGECDLAGEEWCNAQTAYDIRLEMTEDPHGEVLLVLNLQESLYSQESTEVMLESYVKVLKELCGSNV